MTRYRRSTGRLYGRHSVTVDELLCELEQLDPDPEMPVAVDGITDVELSIVYTAAGEYLNIGRKAEEGWP